MVYRGLGKHSRSRPKMRPCRAMDEEGVADVHVASATGSTDAWPSEGGGIELHIAVKHTTLAERCEETRHIQVRSDENFRGRVPIANVREQKQRQQCTAAALYVHPPLSTDIIAAVEVPARVARIGHARKANRNLSADAVPPNPAAGAEKLVVHLAERG